MHASFFIVLTIHLSFDAIIELVVGLLSVILDDDA